MERRVHEWIVECSKGKMKGADSRSFLEAESSHVCAAADKGVSLFGTR